MKKGLALLLAITLAFSLCVPAAAEYTEEYWEGYDQGWDEGCDDGFDDYENGVEPVPAGTYEDGYRDGYNSGYDYGYTEAAWREEYGDDWGWEEPDAEDVIAAYGGVPGAINVMIDGWCVDFAGVRPEQRNGRVMVPVRAILEALGAEVTYDGAAGAVTAAFDGRTLRHVVGTETVEVYRGDADQEPEILMMDCKSYIAGGRTMAPVRFLSEALGYYVEWDQWYRTVVILDTETLCGTYDAKLSVVNLLLSDEQNRQEPGKTYRQDASMKLDLTLFDTLNGDKRLGASGRYTGVFNEKGLNATVNLDLRQVVDLLVEEDSFFWSEEDVRAFKELLASLQIELIYNREADQVYVKSPLIDAVVGQDYWVESSMLEMLGVGSGSLLPALSEDGGALTVSELALLAELDSWSSPVYYYDNLLETLDALAAYAGDHNFQKSGSTYTYRLDLNGLAKLMEIPEDEMAWYFYDVSAIDLSFRVTDTGNGTCDYSGSLYYRASDAELRLDASSRGGSREMSLSMHFKNLLKAAVTGSSVTKPSSETVQIVPPAAELSMTLDEIYS